MLEVFYVAVVIYCSFTDPCTIVQQKHLTFSSRLTCKEFVVEMANDMIREGVPAHYLWPLCLQGLREPVKSDPV